MSAGGAEVKAPEGLSETSDEAWKQARKQVEVGRIACNVNVLI